MLLLVDLGIERTLIFVVIHAYYHKALRAVALSEDGAMQERLFCNKGNRKSTTAPAQLCRAGQKGAGEGSSAIALHANPAELSPQVLSRGFRLELVQSVASQLQNRRFQMSYARAQHCNDTQSDGC